MTEETALSPWDGVYSHREWFVCFSFNRNCASETERNDFETAFLSTVCIMSYNDVSGKFF